jgi:hypothetical protein
VVNCGTFVGVTWLNNGGTLFASEYPVWYPCKGCSRENRNSEMRIGKSHLSAKISAIAGTLRAAALLRG